MNQKVERDLQLHNLQDNSKNFDKIHNSYAYDINPTDMTETNSNTISLFFRFIADVRKTNYLFNKTLTLCFKTKYFLLNSNFTNPLLILYKDYVSCENAVNQVLAPMTDGRC